MKNTFLVVFCTCFLYFNCISQWNLQNVNNSNELYGVEYSSSSSIYIAATDGLIKSTDGGSTWTTYPLIDENNNPILGSWLLDVHFFDATTGVATGMITAGNSEVILRTTNGGVNWKVVNLNNNGAWPRNLNDIYFSDASTGYAVGTNGRILKSTDAGASWSVLSSGTSEKFTSVFFTSNTIGYAVGTNVILKTTNGGGSWTASAFPGVTFEAVHFPTATTGYAVANDSKIYKTTNAGTSWQLILDNSTYAFKDVWFTSQDTGYATSKNLVLKTTNGGTWWEKQTVSSATLHNGIHFLNSSTGFLVGADGKAYKTTNAGGPSSPIASFTTNTSVYCKDSIIKFSNNGPLTYTYQWLLNGNVFSTAHSPVYTFTKPDQTDTITLVAYNGYLYDTARIYPYIEPALNFTMTTTVVKDSICPNASAIIQVNNSVFGVMYELRKGTVRIGSSQYGNGATLSFPTDNISNTTMFNIRGANTSLCGTYDQIAYHTIYVVPNNNALPVSATPPLICKHTSTVITVGNSALGTIYQLKSGGIDIGGPVNGTGTSINFPSGTLDTTTTFQMQAKSPLGCISLLTASITVVVELPKAYIYSTAYNTRVGESIQCYNTSENPNGTYAWDFGVNAVPATSTQAFPPALHFTTLGEKTIWLKAIGEHGCVDTAIIHLNVITYDTTSLCYTSQMSSVPNPGVEAYSTVVDDKGNWYSAGNYNSFNPNYILKLFSENRDTLLIPHRNGNSDMFLSKYNKYGIIQWVVNSFGASVNVACTDKDNNIYLMGSTNGGCRFNSIDKKNPVSVTGGQFYICKYDTTGMLKKIILYPNPANDIDCFSINVDNNGNIYTTSEYWMRKFDKNGIQQWTIPNPNYTNFGDVLVDAGGNVFVARHTALILEKYDANGVLQWQTPPVKEVPPAVIPRVYSKILKQDAKGNLYVFGIFQEKFIFNNTTVVNNNSIFGPQQNDIFIAKFSPDGKPLKLMQGDASFNAYISGAGIKNGNGYVLGTVSEGSISFGNRSINATQTGLFVFQFDTAMVERKITKLYDQNNDSFRHNDALAIDAKEQLYISFSFRDPFKLGQRNLKQIGGCCNPLSFTAKLDTSCVFSGIVTTVPAEKESITTELDAQIYPNPFTYQTTVVFNKELKNVTVRIMDVIGRDIRTLYFTGTQLIIEKGEMNNGIYFIQVMDSEKHIMNKKIIVE